IRCKKCEGVIAVPAAEIEEVAEAVAADEPEPATKKEAVAKSKNRPAAIRADEDDEKPRAKRRRDEEDEDEEPKRRRDEEDEDEPRPKKKGARGGKKKMSRGLIIGISVGAVVLLVGIGVALFFMARPTLRGERELKEVFKAAKEAEAQK